MKIAKSSYESSLESDSSIPTSNLTSKLDTAIEAEIESHRCDQSDIHTHLDTWYRKLSVMPPDERMRVVTYIEALLSAAGMPARIAEPFQDKT